MAKQLNNFSSYEIYPDGKVFSKLTLGFLKTWIGTCGYVYVKMRNDKGKPKNKKVHMMLMELYGPEKPSPDSIVNHIDGDKTNYDLNNLEWSTHVDNLKHAYKTGLRKSHGPVVLLVKGKEFVFDNVNQAKKHFGFSDHIKRVFLKDGRDNKGRYLIKSIYDDTSWKKIKEGSRAEYLVPEKPIIEARNNATGEVFVFKSESKLRKFLKADKNAIRRRLESETTFPLKGWSLREQGKMIPWRKWTPLSLLMHPLRGNIRPYFCPEENIYFSSITKIKEMLFDDLADTTLLQRELAAKQCFRNKKFIKIEIDKEIENSLAIQ